MRPVRGAWRQGGVLEGAATARVALTFFNPSRLRFEHLVFERDELGLEGRLGEQCSLLGYGEGRNEKPGDDGAGHDCWKP